MKPRFYVRSREVKVIKYDLIDDMRHIQLIYDLENEIMARRVCEDLNKMYHDSAKDAGSPVCTGMECCPHCG